jgi:hypothetical protein
MALRFRAPLQQTLKRIVAANVCVVMNKVEINNMAELTTYLGPRKTTF